MVSDPSALLGLLLKCGITTVEWAREWGISQMQNDAAEKSITKSRLRIL